MIAIRRLTAADIDAVLAIEAAAPEAAAWSRQAYETILGDPARGICLLAVNDDARREQITVGFVCFRVIGPEAELLNLAVLPPFRRLGIGARLLGEALQDAAHRGAHEIFLEVRDSNLVARALYKRFGFEIKGRRPKYYHDPPEDALTLHRCLEMPELEIRSW